MHRVQATVHGALAGAVSRDTRTCTTLSVKLHALTVLASVCDTSGTSEGGGGSRSWGGHTCSTAGSSVAALTLAAVFAESGTPDADADAYTASLADMRLVVGEGVALQGCNGESVFWWTTTGILC